MYRPKFPGDRKQMYQFLDKRLRCHGFWSGSRNDLWRHVRDAKVIVRVFLPVDLKRPYHQRVIRPGRQEIRIEICPLRGTWKGRRYVRFPIRSETVLIEAGCKHTWHQVRTFINQVVSDCHAESKKNII